MSTIDNSISGQGQQESDDHPQDSTGGALAGGMIIGIAEAMASGYQEQLLFLGRGFGDVVPYVVMILVLLVRPSGLFGTKELTRV